MFKGINFFIKYSWKFEKSYVIYIFLLQIVDSIVPILSIIMPKYIIDELTGGKNIEKLLLYVILLLGIYFVGSLLSNILRGAAFKKKNDLFFKFQVFLSEQIMRADFERLEQPSFLDLREKAYKFLYADGEGFGVVLDKAVGILSKIIIFIGIIAIIATLNIFIVLILIVLVTINSKFNSKIKEINIKLNLEKVPHERRNEYYSNLFSDFSYGKEIRINSLNNWLLNKYKEQIYELGKFYDKSVNNNLKSMNFGAIVSIFQQIASYAYLIFLIMADTITIGDFSMYLNAINTFSSSMRDVMESIIDIKRFGIYYEAVEEYINTPTKLRGGKRLIIQKKEDHIIRFENVSFKYPGQEYYALKNVSITINPKEKVSVVGENGAGKTTFIKLLTRLYIPTEGTIYLNNIDINDYDYEQYMQLFSAVFQDYKLFSFSIKENVALSESEKTNDLEVEQIVRSSGLSTLVNNLKEGINTNVYKNFNENGFEPSGGQGQKIALARAVFKNSPIVILDEPTAALDPRAEYEIYKNFNELVDGKTAIYISHRLSSAKFCDKIIVFSNGEIIECGSHKELIKLNGEYNELFNMQAEFYFD